MRTGSSAARDLVKRLNAVIPKGVDEFNKGTVTISTELAEDLAHMIESQDWSDESEAKCRRVREAAHNLVDLCDTDLAEFTVVEALEPRPCRVSLGGDGRNPRCELTEGHSGDHFRFPLGAPPPTCCNCAFIAGPTKCTQCREEEA